MDIGFTHAVRGFRDQYHGFEVVSNNLANVSTPGFKRDLYAEFNSSDGYTVTDMREGPMQHTGGPLDFAIQGEGFFEIQTSQGLRYTRQGRFLLNSNKEIVNAAGDRLLSDQGDPIVVDGGSVSVGPDGKMRVDGQELATIGIVTFENSERLLKNGATYFVPGGATGEKKEKPEGTLLSQGTLEQSNVMVPQEMIKMMESLRTFETFQKYMNTASEMDQKATSEVGVLR